MKIKITFLSVLLTVCVNPADLSAQCVILENAEEGITLSASQSGTNNRSGLAFNPFAKLYYSVNAGASTYPLDTYNEAGNILTSPAQGFDYRGAWWNPNLGLFEGNGFSNLGIFIQTLAAGTSYPIGQGAVILTANQPNVQSVGDLDYTNNEIVYYDNGFIHQYSRTDNTFLGQFLIGDIYEGATLNNNSIVYTGCEGLEYGVYDHTNKRVLLVSRSTRKVEGYSQLPETAPARASFGMTYANGLFWLFAGGSWFSYKILGSDATATDERLLSANTVYPNPVSDMLRVNLNPDNAPQRIRLINLNGQIVYEQEIENSFEININMKNYNQGIYLLNIISSENTETKKILVSR